MKEQFIKKMDNDKPYKGREILLFSGLFILLSFVYFRFIGNYLLYFQETQSLFVFSAEYLRPFLSKPGGVLEYAARFLTQFYNGKVAGSLLITIVLAIPLILFRMINRRLLREQYISFFLLFIPSCILLIMQANYFHMMEYNLGFILILVYYLLYLLAAENKMQLPVIILLPLFYYIAGAWVMIFLAMLVIHILFIESGKRRYFHIAAMAVIGGLTFLLFWKVVFLQPIQIIALSPLPLLENVPYRMTFIFLTGYLILYPLICKPFANSKSGSFNKRSYLFLPVVFVYSITIMFLFRTYNPQTARTIELERLVFSEKWDEAISLHEEKSSRNLIGQYFYNIALSERGQLCDRLFHGSQDFAAGALVLPWGDEHLNRGAYFYYSIGLINEAHRWAYEEMIVYGQRPQNIRLLAKTSLINADYRMARKYIGILKKTAYYRKEAGELETLLDNPELIKSHPELGEKMKLVPKTNFFIQFNEPQNNLPLILEGQPDNKKAIEYYLAGLLLTKKVEICVNNIRNLKESGYDRIPRHVEEAAMIYYNSTRTMPDLGGLTISPETRARFDHYFSSYMVARQAPETMKEKMQKQFGDTFWYYFHFN